MALGNKIFSRNEIFAVQLETTYGIIPNTAGVATVTGTNALRMIQLKIDRMTDKYVRKDKTGSRSATPGVGGRKMAKWSSNCSLVTNGTAAVVPDIDPIFQSAFGQAATVYSGTATITAATNATPIVVTAAGHGLSNYQCVNITGVGGNVAANGAWCVRVVDANTLQLLGSTGSGAYTSGGSINKAALQYSPVDTPLLSFSAYSFRLPTTAAQRAMGGAVTQKLTFNLGEEIATIQGDGIAKWYIDQVNFSNANVTEQMGLTAFPTQASLGTLVTNGTGIPGFQGRAVLNDGTVARIRTSQVDFNTGVDLPRDLFGTAYVDSPEADERNVTVQLNAYEDDTAGQFALEQSAINATGIDLVYLIGTVPGNQYILVLQNVQLNNPERDDTQRSFTENYGASRAYGTTITSLDEFRLWVL